VILSFVLIGVLFVSASFDDDDYQLYPEYPAGGQLSGWVEMEFDDEPMNSIFTDSAENSVRLGDLLDISKNNGYNYTCDLEDCKSEYGKSAESQEKTFNLVAGQTQLIGLYIEGEINSIDSLKFSFESDAPESCENQIKLDFFLNEEYEIFNNKASENVCEERNTGCFPSGNYDDALIQSTPYCQEIEFEGGADFMIGAWIKEKAAGTKELRASLYDLEGDKLSECVLSKTPLSAGGGFTSCDSLRGQETSVNKYVCISASSGDGEYTVASKSLVEGCGFLGNPPKTQTSSYYIFNQKRKYATPGKIHSEEIIDKENFGTLVKNYIVQEYGNLDCTDGCIIPISIVSNSDQTFTINNMSFIYDKGNPIVEDEFYTLEENYAKVSSDMQKLYLDSPEFTLPTELGTFSYELFFKNNQLFEEDIEIISVPLSLTPTDTAVFLDTEFKVNVGSEKEIENYEWDFGDGVVNTTTQNKINYKYSEQGNYALIVSVNFEDGSQYSKSFTVTVASAETTVNKTLETLNTNIDSLKLQLLDYDFFVKEEIETKLDLINIEEEIYLIEANLSGESDYEEILERLFSFAVPSSIVEVEYGELNYFQKENNINSLDVMNISLENLDSDHSEGEYRTAIMQWTQQNTQSRIAEKEIYFKYGLEFEPSMKVFELSISKDTAVNPYLVFNYIPGLSVKENVFENGELKYLQLTSSNKKITFSTDPDVEIEELDLYIAPALSELQLISIVEPTLEKEINWKLWLGLVAVILLGFLAYFVMVKWSQIKHRKKLFKDDNQIYNLIH